MILNVDKASLLKSLLIADSIISSKSINTILANCLFNISENEIEILSTDNEIAVRTKVDAVCDSKGSFTVNGKKFSSILKELPDDELVLTVNDSIQIDIKTKSGTIKGHYTLIGTSSEDYPEIQEFTYDNSIEIEQRLLKDIFKKVVYAASIDTIKPVFNGVFIVSEQKGKITAVATDSRRLSIISRDIENDIDLGDGVVVPLKTIHEIFRILESSGNCVFSVKNNQFFFKAGKTEFISRIVDGQFPNYKQVIPKDYVLEASINPKTLLETIRRAMIFTREPANKIVLHFSHNKLKIEAKTPELGEAEEELSITSKSKEGMSIGINAQFLIDCLKEIDSETIVCGITGQMSPVTIIPNNDTLYTSVIMPIQIKSQHND
jgi:DNA polymerase III subunit beta